MSSFFEKLEKETEEGRENLFQVPLIHQALNGEISKELYLAYLEQAYHHVKYTVPLLMLCGSRLPLHEHGLQKVMSEYIDEEMGHEQWILKDILHVGGDVEQVKTNKPAWPTELMISYAYDTLMRGNPVAFFGMVYVLEGTSVSIATKVAHCIQESLNLGVDCFSYLLSHGDLDQDHIKFFEKTVNQISDEQDQKDIIHMAQMMYRLFANVLADIPNQVK